MAAVVSAVTAVVAAIVMAVTGSAIPAVAVPSTVAAPSASASASQLTGKVYRVTVRTATTDANARRMQAAVDAGGQVAITYRWMERVIISAHNYADATALKLRRGDVVVLKGKVAGRYRVTGATVVRTGSSSAQVLGLKAQLMMQTCLFGTNDSRVVGLVKVAAPAATPTVRVEAPRARR